MKTNCWGNLKWLKSLCCCFYKDFWNSIGLHEFRIDSSKLSQLSGLYKPANALVLWWNFLSEELPYALVDLLAAIVVALTRILILFGFRWIVFLLNREYLFFVFLNLASTGVDNATWLFFGREEEVLLTLKLTWTIFVNLRHNG